jgi:UrcA family protein
MRTEPPVTLNSAPAVDPSTIERAREQLRDTAQKLCNDAARSIHLPPHRDIDACVNDTLSAAVDNRNSTHTTNAVTVAGTSAPPRTASKRFDPDKRSMRVSVADLDQSTPEGARIAEQRLRHAARVLCGRLSDELDLGSQPHFVACVDQAMADAQRSLAMQLSAQNLRPAGH